MGMIGQTARGTADDAPGAMWPHPSAPSQRTTEPAQGLPRRQGGNLRHKEGRHFTQRCLAAFFQHL